MEVFLCPEIQVKRPKRQYFILWQEVYSCNDIIQRKIALYSQDAAHVITARFTLTAPKLTILSPNASIQHGTFKGDLYVSVNNFKLVDAKVDGNIYFTTEEAMTTFTMDDKSSITGKQELKK